MTIWKSKNVTIFNNEIFLPLAFLFQAKKRKKKDRIKNSNSHVGSPSRYIKTNFNRSLTNSSSTSGFILCDWRKKLIKVGVAHYSQTSISAGKPRELRGSVASTIQASFDELVIKWNNQTTISTLKGNIHIPWQISRRCSGSVDPIYASCHQSHLPECRYSIRLIIEILSQVSFPMTFFFFLFSNHPLWRCNWMYYCEKKRIAFFFHDLLL